MNKITYHVNVTVESNETATYSLNMVPIGHAHIPTASMFDVWRHNDGIKDGVVADSDGNVWELKSVKHDIEFSPEYVDSFEATATAKA